MEVEITKTVLQCSYLDKNKDKIASMLIELKEAFSSLEVYKSTYQTSRAVDYIIMSKLSLGLTQDKRILLLIYLPVTFPDLAPEIFLQKTPGLKFNQRNSIIHPQSLKIFSPLQKHWTRREGNLATTIEEIKMLVVTENPIDLNSYLYGQVANKNVPFSMVKSQKVIEEENRKKKEIIANINLQLLNSLKSSLSNLKMEYDMLIAQRNQFLKQLEEFEGYLKDKNYKSSMDERISVTFAHLCSLKKTVSYWEGKERTVENAVNYFADTQPGNQTAKCKLEARINSKEEMLWALKKGLEKKVLPVDLAIKEYRKESAKIFKAKYHLNKYNSPF